jgi:hypothetical protein
MDIRLALGQHKNVVTFRRNVGTFYTRNGAPIRVGHIGEPDLQGFIGDQVCPSCNHPIHPKPFMIEVKSAAGKLREQQKVFKEHVAERLGILYFVARSVKQALTKLDL